VVVLGASTNLASALLIAPDIAPRLRVFLLGTAPPENTARAVHVFRAIDAPAMRADFFAAFEAAFPP
jgi:hypothetical protein